MAVAKRNPELGAFLRTRRARLEPGGLGLSAEGFRRVPGLRREEVAGLAGVSPDYYTRLEQGRQPTASPSVLEALAHALRLSSDERLHLYALAGEGAPPSADPPAPGAAVAHRAAQGDTAPAGDGGQAGHCTGTIASGAIRERVFLFQRYDSG